MAAPCSVFWADTTLLCPQEQCQHQEQQPKKLRKEQEKEAKEAWVAAASAGTADRWLDVTTDLQVRPLLHLPAQERRKAGS